MMVVMPTLTHRNEPTARNVIALHTSAFNIPVAIRPSGEPHSPLASVQ